MRIDKFTEIFNIDSKNFLFNSGTGAIDELEPCKAGLYPANPANPANLEQPETDIAKEITRLKKKGSFTPLECSLKESLIDELIERGYITYYSDTEEADERKWLLEKYKEKAKKEEKTASILLDTVIGNNWCFTDDAVKNSAMDKTKFADLLRAISKNKLTVKIDLWLIIKNRKTEWEWISNQVNKNSLIINSIFTFVKNEKELEDIKDWMTITLSAPKVVHIKYEKQEFEYFNLTKINNKIIKKKNIIFLTKHPFFCPFIYKTFFIDQTGNISYCVRKLANKEKPVNRAVMGKLDFTASGITFKQGWSDKLFNANCDKPDSCIYSIYCNKMCPYLSSIYEKSKSENECNVIPVFESLLKTKIKSMV